MMSKTYNNNVESINNWKRVRDNIHSKWRRFTNREVEAMKNDLDLLRDQLQKSYGYTRSQAIEEYSHFIANVEEPEDTIRGRFVKWSTK